MRGPWLSPWAANPANHLRAIAIIPLSTAPVDDSNRWPSP